MSAKVSELRTVDTHFQPLSQSHNLIVMSSYDCISNSTLSMPQIKTHAGSQDKGLCWVHSNGADVVWVCLERSNLLRGIVVVDTQLEVIGT